MPDKDPVELGEETIEDILEGVPESDDYGEESNP